MMKYMSWWKCMLILVLCMAGSFAPMMSQAEAPQLTFSLESGFYRDVVTLYITCDVPDADIYYTLDGSAPDETDWYYDDGIELDFTTEKPDPLSLMLGTVSGEEFQPFEDFPSAHVVRAMAVLPDGSSTEEACGTYFIGYDRVVLYGDTPIVSLMMEADDLFDHERGIYVLGACFDAWAAEQTAPFESWQAQGNFTQRGREWERPVTMEFMPAEGEGFTQEMGIRIKGGASRGYKQKSLRLIARDDYGKKNVKYPLFPDNLCEADGEVLQKYKSFTLRNGGNDAEFAKIRDPYIKRLATGMRMETAADRPVIAFINGEYWGLYTLNEEYTDNYIDYHYGINNDNVVTFKNGNVEDGEDEDKALYWDMQVYIREHDMSDPTCYAKACEMLDMGSFADYLAVALYIGNEDGIFHNNNWQMWRVREPGQDDSPYADGKWRMMLFDCDYSSGVYSDGKNFDRNELLTALSGKDVEEWTPSAMVQSLLKSEEFRQELVMSLCDVRNLFFEKGRAGALLERMTAAYQPYGRDTFCRFGPEWVARWQPDSHFPDKLRSVGTYFQGRYNLFPGMVSRAFDLEPSVFVTVESSDGTKGCVYLNERPIPITAKLSTKYFTEYPVTLTAVPEAGHRFLRWETQQSDVVIADPTAMTTEVYFKKGCIITAVFE